MIKMIKNWRCFYVEKKSLNGEQVLSFYWF
nr:MAG TPA: hypothetical protein [Caudoviricetes sp.]DAU20686.1 MAG TPA: hypothetical protein [Caudoviricetes sp.]